MPTVAEFAPASNETEKALSYPFSCPDSSYITDGQEVHLLPDSFAEFQEATDAYLAEHGLPLLAERVPVLAYGSNANPFRLGKKMGTYAPHLQETMQTVPNRMITVPDAAVVWHGKPGQAGSAFAELYKGAETVGEKVHAHIGFLTVEQLAAMHATEGVTYHLAELEARVGDNPEPIKFTAYVAGASSILLKAGKPVRVQRPGEEQHEGSMTAEEAVNYMLEHAGETIGAKTARELIEQNKALPLSEKKIRQAAVGTRLGELGLNKSFSFPTKPGSEIGRADFNFITSPKYDFIHLAEQSLAAMRPTPETIQARQQELMEQKGLSEVKALKEAKEELDIMVNIRQRASDELKDRLNSNPAV